MNVIYNSIPVSSVVLLSSEERLPYIEKAVNLPPNLRELVFSDRTSAYLRGLLKTQDIPEKLGPQLAFTVLQVAIGETPLNQLSGTISMNLSIPTTKAQQLALDIEKELFAPIALDLNSNLKQKFTQPKPVTPPLTQPTVAAQGVRNVVDLKQQTARPPVPPPMPPNVPRPGTTPLPSRPVQSRPLQTSGSFDRESLKKKSQLWEDK